MSELDWERHLTTQRRDFRKTKERQTPVIKTEYVPTERTLRILNGMDLIIKDFLRVARSQGFPGGQPSLNSKESDSMSYRWVDLSRKVVGKPILTTVSSSGNWSYEETAPEDVSKVDSGGTTLRCQNLDSTLGARNHYSEYYRDEPTDLYEDKSDKLMGILARIAVENDINL